MKKMKEFKKEIVNENLTILNITAQGNITMQIHIMNINNKGGELAC